MVSDVTYLSLQVPMPKWLKIRISSNGVILKIGVNFWGDGALNAYEGGES